MSLGSGYNGRNVFSELKVLTSLLQKDFFSYDEVLRMITVNPARALKISDNYGSIEKNKFANLVFFNLCDLRNILNVPETNSEKISEFLIDNFDTKDISDVIIKGIPVKRNNQCKLYNPETIKQIKTSLTVGKYLELKEKYLMRKRVNELTGTENEKSAIYDDNYNVEDYSSLDSKSIMDSEFKILGIDKEFNGNVINELDGYDNIIEADINELDSLSDGFLVFEEEIADAKAKVKAKGQEVPKEVTMRFDDTSGTDNDTINEVKENKKEEEMNKDTIKEEQKVQFKKEKLRFGFSDEK
ncbi:MAG: amidohydrolase family protein [Ignavibacteriae bacterium]|nr:amidohydrolase family protein [Ignavibacteriota bacterium]